MPVQFSGWFQLSRCCRLQAVGNVARSAHPGPALTLFLFRERKKKTSVRGSGRGHKNAGRARLRTAVHSARHRCFMGDSFVCSAVGIIFPSKLRYTWNNGEIKT